jgi:hypothetical protein
MQYLNPDFLSAFDAEAFRATQPFPFLNPQGALTETGFQKLAANMPDPRLFTRNFGTGRAYGQASHDRLTLDYHEDLPIDPVWHEFVRELRGDAYHRLLRRALGRGFFRLLQHWHYTPTGCSVSPHCDSPRKLGSHIFYFNTPADWDADWGGGTLILEDHGRIKPNSAPDFADFDREIPTETLDNRSLLFTRKAGSWHGVRALRCPPGVYRKVFIVVIEDPLLGAAHRLVKAAKRRVA